MSPALRDGLVFQLGWFCCVAGGNRGALFAAVVLVPLQATWPGQRSISEWRMLLLFAAVGLAMDLGWQALGVLAFKGQLLWSTPGWLVVLWLMFAGTLFRSLAFLQDRLVLAAVLGALSGPLSYMAGIRLGAAQSGHPDSVIALAMAPAWAILLPLFACLARGRKTAGTSS